LKAELDATSSDKEKGQAAVLEDWKQAVAAAPESYDAHAGLSGCLLHAGSDKQKWAEDEAKRALAIDPSRIAAYRLLAEIYARTEQWQNLEAILKRARSAVPDDLSPDFTAAQTILDRNIQSQYAQAESFLRNYLSQPVEGLEPTLAIAHWRLGLVLEKEGRRTTALTEVQTAVNLDASLDAARKDIKRLQ
jgi:tetratricopeptide (TPR) repeat protein